MSLQDTEFTRDRSGWSRPIADAPRVPRGERGDADAILAWALRAFGLPSRRIALVSSLGPQTLVVLDLLHRAGLEVPVLFIDTDLHFALTYALRREVERHYGIEIVNLRPAIDLSDQGELYGDALWERDPDLCCAMRKVEPLRRGLAGFDAWISGLRRGQGESRQGAEAVEWDPVFGLHKINPLVGWSRADVEAYLDENKVPYNPLLDDGYTSIGCSPCTQRAAGNGERAGRWVGTGKTECGLHKLIHLDGERRQA